MNLGKIYNRVKYIFGMQHLSLQKPVVLQFPVIDICNSQCQMCRIWENKKSDDISPEQLRVGLRNSLFSEVESLGLNGGEPTLRKDLGQLVTVLFEELPRLRSISLITNAYKYDEVIDRIRDVGKVVNRYGGCLDVMVSLDGVGEVHDKIRGKPGNFERALHVIEFAQASPLVHSVRIGCTIVKENVFGVSDLFEFCQSKGLYIKYRLGIPHQRLYTKNLLDPYALDASEKYHVAEFLEGLIAHYETSEHQKFFYRSLIDQIVLQAPRKSGCDWKHQGATITSKGELLYCAVQSKVLGNITEHDSEQRYFGNENYLKSIIQNHCDSCSHDYVGIPPREVYAEMVVIQLARKLHVENLLKKLYRTLIKNDLYLTWKFFVRIDNLFKLEGAQADWPKGGEGKRILICGWYGTETLGDKAILAGILESFQRHLGFIDIVLVSLYPYVSEMTCGQMAELTGVRIVDRKNGLRLVAKADLVVFGGGPLMAIDETGDMLAIFKMAKKAGIKIMVAGCGVGPLGSIRHNLAIKRILQLADVRIYRDEESLLMAAKLGVDIKSDQASEDPAFTWLQTQHKTLLQKEHFNKSRVLLLGLRDFPHATYALHLSKSDRLEAKRRFEVAIIDALEQLIVQYPDLIIRPLPMCTNHFGEDDRWFYRRIFRGKAKLTHHLDLSFLGAELSPSQYCMAFMNSSAALTMRFHSLVFALGLKVPTVAIDYTLGQGKVYALAERFGVSARSVANIDADFIVREVSRLMDTPHLHARNFIPTFSLAIRDALLKLGFKVG